MARVLTSSRRAVNSLSNLVKFSSVSALTQMSATAFIQPASFFISLTPRPRVVIAGVPRRTPEGRKAPPLSVGRELAFKVSPIISSAFS